RVGYAGDLVTGLVEYGSIYIDLIEVGAIGVVMVLGVLLLFFRRGRVLWVLGANIVAGLALTFGVTDAFIGHLTIGSGFLVSILAGNGINAGIIYMARYVEARYAGEPPDAAVVTTTTATWLPTFGAATAAAAAYGSLAVTGFRGLEHMGFVGATGMLLCWL